MNYHQPKSITPGMYQYRPNQFMPWLNVRVFRDSAQNHDKLCVRFAGVEFDADMFIRHGQWKAL